MNKLTVEELNKLMLLLAQDSSNNPENEKNNDELWNKLWDMKREVL